eukprot:3697418-Prymnesium_polylepis.1
MCIRDSRPPSSPHPPPSSPTIVVPHPSATVRPHPPPPFAPISPQASSDAFEEVAAILTE